MFAQNLSDAVVKQVNKTAKIGRDYFNYQDRNFSRHSIATFLSVAFITNSVASPSVQAQTAPPSLAPVELNQPQAPPQFIPTDITPYTVLPERYAFYPGYKFRLFKKLPERLWFNVTTEISQRLDTNVLFTYSSPKADYAFRALPNINLGWNIARNTSIYTNYFAIKDVFATNYSHINFPTTQSLSWGIQHNKQIGDRTTAQFNFQARELWQARDLHQFDFIPGATLTRVLTPRDIVFASTLLQLRGGDYFVAPTREIDPFYTLGYVRRMGLWAFIFNDTFVTNFRHPPFNDSIPRQSNMTMITDVEVNHPISKRFPDLLAFVRAEPIWNWDSHKAPGISGFDFRLYGGLRLTINKPSYYGAMQDMRKQIMQPKPPKQNPANSPQESPSDNPFAPAAPLNSPNNNSNSNNENDSGKSLSPDSNTIKPIPLSSPNNGSNIELPLGPALSPSINTSSISNFPKSQSNPYLPESDTKWTDISYASSNNSFAY